MVACIDDNRDIWDVIDVSAAVVAKTTCRSRIVFLDLLPLWLPG